MKKLYPFLLLAAFILPACSGQPAQATQPAVTTHVNTPLPVPIPTKSNPTAAELEATDPSQPIQVSAGNEFTITVKTDPLPTENHWEVAVALDAKIVDYVWKEYFPDKPDNPNSSGKEIWRFKAVGPGQTTITLGYYQGMTVNAVQLPVYTIVVK